MLGNLPGLRHYLALIALNFFLPCFSLNYSGNPPEIALSNFPNAQNLSGVAQLVEECWSQITDLTLEVFCENNEIISICYIKDTADDVIKNKTFFAIESDEKRSDLKYLSSTIDREFRKNFSEVSCLCLIPGHCFLSEPYTPKFLLLYTRYLPKTFTDDSNGDRNSTFAQFFSLLASRISRCNDTLIWVVSQFDRKLVKFCGSDILCSRGFFPQFKVENISERSVYPSSFIHSASMLFKSEISKVGLALQHKVQRAKWNSENFPNPKTNWSLCGSADTSWLCDPDNFLSHDEALLIQATLEMIPYQYICFCPDVRNCSEFPSGPKVYVAVVEKVLKTRKNQQDSVKAMADTLRLKWKYQLCDDVVVILYSVHDQYLYVSLGRVIEVKLTQRFTFDLLTSVPELVVENDVYQVLNATLGALEAAFLRYMEDRERYMLFIQILLVSLVVMTPFACLMGLSFTK